MKPPGEGTVRYEADEALPGRLAAGLGLQLATLGINAVVLVAAIIYRAGSGAEGVLLWGVFGAVLFCGVSTILQALGFGRIGAGCVILHGTSSIFISVCVTALAAGGPALLATLVVASALIQVALSTRLSLLRRLLTPTVTGTVIMLLPVTVMPILFRMLNETPEGGTRTAAALSALVTVSVILIVGVALRSAGSLRLWGPVFGVVAGTVVAALFGIYDVREVVEAAWIGVPRGGWPGLDLSFPPAFWGLLPVFVFVTLVGTTKSVGVAVAVQRVSWRRRRAVNFRRVQGAVAAEGVGNLLAGLAGTVPNTPYPGGVSVVELTGVAARSVGIMGGAAFIVLAFVPKALALILAVPGAVVAGFIAMAMALLFVAGMREVIADAKDYRKGLIAGVSFWTGAGFQSGMIFPDYFATFAGGLLQNGMAAGCLTAILLTLLMEVAAPRRSRYRGRLDGAELPAINSFLDSFANRNGWRRAMVERLQAAGEETLLTLMRKQEEQAPAAERGDGAKHHLLLTARKESGGAVLEFIASAGEGNLQDQIALLREQPPESRLEQEVSLRLLHHLTSSVVHQQYHNADVVTVRVDPPAAADGGE